jgi:3-hydroxyisobutyrate dehydrogenase-like beta-hydroxyacid dehydrogenase
MVNKKIGILHPGQMGEYIAAMLKAGGHEIYWVSENRSSKTRARAEKQGFIELKTLDELCHTCSIILSICPPSEAEEVAKQVLVCSYKGVYCDANAIQPKRSVRIGRMMTDAHISYIDGGIIGNPSWDKGATSLYLSGDNLPQFIALFPQSNLEVHALGEEIGKASAIKMCYAGYTKGSTALLASLLALSEANGVRDALEYEWTKDGMNLADNAKMRTSRVTAKAWRFAGEMEEIAATFKDASLPDGFHKAAAEIYRRMTHFKDAPQFPDVEQVLKALLKSKE